MVVETCLAYLSLDVFGHGYCRNAEQSRSLLENNPFLDYAARHWGYHARPHQESVESLVLDFLSDDAKVACAGQVLSRKRFNPSFCFQQHALGMHLAAYFGLWHIVNRQLENRALANPTDSNPLSYADDTGHELPHIPVYLYFIYNEGLTKFVDRSHLMNTITISIGRSCQKVDSG